MGGAGLAPDTAICGASIGTAFTSTVASTAAAQAFAIASLAASSTACMGRASGAHIGCVSAVATAPGRRKERILVVFALYRPVA